MLPNKNELTQAATDPSLMRAVAVAFAQHLQFAEALHWYQTYLRHCPHDEEARQAMRALEATRAHGQRLREVYEFVHKCHSRLRLADVALAQNLQLLDQAVGHGAFQEADERAKLVQHLLETVMRKQWQLKQSDNLWWEAAHRASDGGMHDLALELLRRSSRYEQEKELYETLAAASDLLELADRYYLSHGQIAQNLREAILLRDPEALNKAIKATDDWYTDKDSNEDDSPGAGVPRFPLPPTLSAGQKKEWPLDKGKGFGEQ